MLATRTGCILSLSLLLSGIARADLHGPLVRVAVHSAHGDGLLVVPPNPDWYDRETGTWSWQLPEPAEIRNPHTQEVLAVLQSGSVLVRDDPVINLGFSVLAGESDTDFSISSATLPIAPPFSSASGNAGAAVMITDLTGGGALLSGNGGVSGTASYLAHYNGGVPDGTAFAELLPSAVAGEWSTESFTDGRPPGGGYEPITGNLHNMSSMMTFNLTAGDLASGTTFFEIIPEPGAAAMLLVVLVLRRRS